MYILAHDLFEKTKYLLVFLTLSDNYLYFYLLKTCLKLGFRYTLTI